MQRTSLPQKIVPALVMLLLALSFAATAYAHGVVITYTLKANGEVELLAEFDTGEPMAEGQVTVYSPEDPLTPWLTGTADAAGRYTFVIDPELPGNWDIQIRKAGHGDIIHLQLEAGMIDPALLSQPPGELLPDTPAVETTAAGADVAETEPGAAAAEEKSDTTVENVLDAAPETGANNQITGAETEAAAAEVAAAETATAAEARETLPDESEEMEAGLAPVIETEPAVEPEPETQAKAAPDLNPAEKETVAETAPHPANAPQETDAVAVLSSGGNTAATGGFTTFQILLMSASVIWGFVGTALYFSGQKTHGHLHE